MSKPVKIFIVEGVARDYRFIGEMTRCFFTGKYDAKVIRLPTEMNVYMLYSLLKDDDFESDVIEVLRERSQVIDNELAGISRQQIDEVFLFFDFDAHQNNLPSDTNTEKVLKIMLSVFDNETENGKLYISYPMIEALYDVVDLECRSNTDCFVQVKDFPEYKRLSAERNSLPSRTLRIQEWKMILSIFGLRISCLFDKQIDYQDYSGIEPSIIYYRQMELYDQCGQCFVLSALPEFLYDYFREDFWNANNKLRKNRYRYCPKEYMNLYTR